MGGTERLVVGYTDSDWGSNPNDRRSITGNVFLLGGASIGWMSKKQSITATSTCEAEYVAAAACARHILLLRNVFLDLGFPQQGSTPIFCDNQAAISLSRDFQFHAKSKHIDIQHHFIRDVVSDGSVTVSYVPGEENPADLFTKGLARVKHIKFTADIGLLPA